MSKQLSLAIGLIIAAILSSDVLALTVALHQHSQDIRQVGEALNAFPSIVEIVTLANKDAGKKIAAAAQPTQQVGDLMITVAHLLDSIEPLLISLPQTKDRMVCTLANKDIRTKSARCQELQCIDRTQCTKKIVRDIKIMVQVLIDHLVLGFVDNQRMHISILDSVLNISQQQKVKTELAPVIDALKITVQILNEIEKLIK